MQVTREGRRLMARSCVAVALATLLALAGSVSAQTACLTWVPDLLPEYCSAYLADNSVSSPDSYCCNEVISVPTNYGADCLCQVILYYQANPDTNPLVIPGRLYNLPSACNADADMSNCSPPPSAPPASISTPPGVTTPTLGVPSAPASGSKASTGALVGGSVGGVSVLGVIVYGIVKCLQNANIDVKWDVNSPCCCCHRREKPHPSNGIDGVPYKGPHPAPHPAPYPARYPVHYGAHA